MDNLPTRRIVITGMGVIAPNGCTLDAFWASIRDGRSAAGPLTRFDPSDLPTRICAEVRDFEARDYMDRKTARRLDRSLQLSVSAAHMAVNDSGLKIASVDPDRVGVVEATSVSNNEMAFKSEDAFQEKGFRGLSPYALINGYCGAGSGEIAAELGIHGLAITCSSGSASGNDVMGYAAGLIRNDDVDVMIAGGAEAPILPPLWGAFCHAHVMTRNNNDPLRSMRPFDADRDGFLLGEGGAFVVLEELSHALLRGARIYAEFVSHGRSCEAYHPVAPHPDGIGVIRAMEKALRQACMNIEEIDYVNVHGTATNTNDLVETNALKKLFGPHAYRLAISSTKPVTGHLLAAAGAIETVVTALSLNRQEIPLTLNLETPEPGLDLDYVKNGSRPYPVRAAMNLSSGFGGKNACLILARYP